LLGLAFKRDTNDIRNSPSIDIVNFLLGKQVKEINCFDPAAMPMFKNIFPESEQVEYSSNELEAIKDADVIIIATDWPQFRGLADILMANNNKPLIMDGRRMLQHRYSDLVAGGFTVIAVGSPLMRGV
jgi:UDPglucose 6-dehydrogenase